MAIVSGGNTSGGNKKDENKKRTSTASSAVNSRVNTGLSGSSGNAVTTSPSSVASTQGKATSAPSTVQQAVNNVYPTAAQQEAAAQAAYAAAEQTPASRPTPQPTPAQEVIDYDAQARYQYELQQQQLRAQQEAAAQAAAAEEARRAEEARQAEAARQAELIRQQLAERAAAEERERAAKEAEAERQRQAEEEAARVAAQQKAEQEAAAEAERQRQAALIAEQMRARQEAEAQARAQEEAEREARRQAEIEAKRKAAEQEKLAQRQAEAERAAQLRAELEAQRQAEEEARRQEKEATIAAQQTPLPPVGQKEGTPTGTQDQPQPSGYTGNGGGAGGAGMQPTPSQQLIEELSGSGVGAETTLTPDQIRELQQNYMGIEPTGVWDEYTQSWAKGISAGDIWNAYQASAAWDFGPNGNPSDEARRWAATYATADYAQWLVQRGEAPDMETALQIARAVAAGRDPSSAVTSSTSTATGTGQGGTLTSMGYSGASDMTALLRQQAAARIEAELAGLKGAYEQSMLGLEGEMRAVPGRYDSARRQLSEADIIARRNFDERALANGISSGARVQADLSRSNAYKNALSGIETAQAQDLDDVGLRIAQLRAQYEAAQQQARAENDATLASDLYKEMVRMQDAQAKAAQEAAKAEQPTLSAAQVNSAIKSGILTDSVLDAYEYYYGAPYATVQGSAATGTSSGGGTGSGSGYSNGGVSAENVKLMQQSLGVAADGKWGPVSSAAAGGLTADEAWMRFQAAGGASGSGSQPSYSGVTPTARDGQVLRSEAQLGSVARNALNTARSAPDQQTKMNIVQSRAAAMSDAELAFVMQQLGLA